MLASVGFLRWLCCRWRKTGQIRYVFPHREGKRRGELRSLRTQALRVLTLEYVMCGVSYSSPCGNILTQSCLWDTAGLIQSIRRKHIVAQIGCRTFPPSFSVVVLCRVRRRGEPGRRRLMVATLCKRGARLPSFLRPFPAQEENRRSTQSVRVRPAGMPARSVEEESETGAHRYFAPRGGNKSAGGRIIPRC